jgi:hypothetical protein
MTLHRALRGDALPGRPNVEYWLEIANARLAASSAGLVSGRLADIPEGQSSTHAQPDSRQVSAPLATSRARTN